MVDNSDETTARYLGFVADQARLEAKLAELDVEREDTRKQLEHTRRIVIELGAMCDQLHIHNLSFHGITDACRAVIIEAAPEYLSARDIKERLEKGGFDLSRYENPSASIYTILNRLEASNYAEKKSEGLNVLYRWKKSQKLMRRKRLVRRKRQLNATTENTNKRAEAVDAAFKAIEEKFGKKKE